MLNTKTFVFQDELTEDSSFIFIFILTLSFMYGNVKLIKIK